MVADESWIGTTHPAWVCFRSEQRHKTLDTEFLDYILAIMPEQFRRSGCAYFSQYPSFGCHYGNMQLTFTEQVDCSERSHQRVLHLMVSWWDGIHQKLHARGANGRWVDRLQVWLVTDKGVRDEDWFIGLGIWVLAKVCTNVKVDAFITNFGGCLPAMKKFAECTKT